VWYGDMTNLICRKCGTTWDGQRHNKCPNCEKNYWMSYTGLLKEKHDPRLLPSAHNKFRSVVHPDFIHNREPILDHLANNGTAYFTITHRSKPCKVATMHSGINAGSAIPSGSALPTHSLNSVIIVNTESDPHIFAEDENNILKKIQYGIMLPFEPCGVPECNNLRLPNSDFCAKHMSPPLAD